MFRFLKKCLLWSIVFVLLIGISGTSGYLVGAYDAYQAARQPFIEQGIQAGINAALNDAAKRGFGRWVAQPGIGSAPAQTRFLWLDDEFKPTPQDDPFNFNPMKPHDGVEKIGTPDKDRGAQKANPCAVQLCTIRKGYSLNENGTLFEFLFDDDPAQQKMIKLPAPNPLDPCDPVNFLYFLLFLGLVAILALSVGRLATWYRTKKAVDGIPPGRQHNQ